MQKRFTLALLLCGIFFMVQPCYAEDLIEVYQQALTSDPNYANAEATMLASKEVRPQAIANLLPLITGQASSTAVHQTDRSTSNGQFVQPGNSSFSRNAYQFDLTQPLLDFSKWMQVAQATSQVHQAAATFGAAGQDLMVRVSKAYFDVLAAQDVMHFANAKKMANAQQLDQAEQRYKVGLDAITSVYEAQAAYDRSVAEEIAAANDVKNRREDLRAITGNYYASLAHLKSKLILKSPTPNNIDTWVDYANQHNLTLESARFAAKAAEENIRINAGGHLPSLDLTGRYEYLYSGSGRTGVTTDATEKDIGVQLAIPIFAGGSVVSKTRQAGYQYQAARANLTSVYRLAVNQTRQRFNSVISGISKINADRRAVRSAQSSLESAEAAFKVGTRTMVDVLIAQQNLFNAQLIHANDQYAFINDILNLKQAAGTLKIQDLEEINSLLAYLPLEPKTNNKEVKKTRTPKKIPAKRKIVKKSNPTRKHVVRQNKNKSLAIKKLSQKHHSNKAAKHL